MAPELVQSQTQAEVFARQQAAAAIDDIEVQLDGADEEWLGHPEVRSIFQECIEQAMLRFAAQYTVWLMKEIGDEDEG